MAAVRRVGFFTPAVYQHPWFPNKWNGRGLFQPRPFNLLFEVSALSMKVSLWQTWFANKTLRMAHR